MKPMEHEEISGLMDGELSPGDAERVRQAIAGDEMLRAEHEEAAALDSDLKALAAAAVFEPRVSLPPISAPAISRFNALGLIAAALILRVALKAMPMSSGYVIAAGVLAFTIWCMVGLLRASDRERLTLLDRESFFC